MTQRAYRYLCAFQAVVIALLLFGLWCTARYGADLQLQIEAAQHAQ